MNKFTIKIPVYKTCFTFCIDCSMQEALDEAGLINDLPEGLQGFCVKEAGKGPFIYVDKSNNLPTAAHEIYHGVYRQLESMNIDDQEAIAYTLEYVFGEYLKKIKKSVI